MRNTAIEKELNRKTKSRYKGPYRVIRQMSKGSYELQELDGTPLRYSVAAFRVIPYISRDLSKLQQLASDSDESNSE